MKKKQMLYQNSKKLPARNLIRLRNAALKQAISELLAKV